MKTTLEIAVDLLLSNSDHITGDTPHRDAKVDVITLHPQGWIGQSARFETGFHIAPPKPYLYGEPVPEFDGLTPSLDDIRRSVWETALAGAGWVNQNDPSFGWDLRAAMAAQAPPGNSSHPSREMPCCTSHAQSSEDPTRQGRPDADTGDAVQDPVHWGARWSCLMVSRWPFVCPI